MLRNMGHGRAAPRYITGLRRKGFVPPLKAARTQAGDRGGS